MDGIRIGTTILFLTEIPGRKGLAFCFKKDGVLTPVSYVNSKLREVAAEHWERMLDEINPEGRK